MSSTWNDSAATVLLGEHAYEELVAAVGEAMDTHRVPRCVNWCIQLGYRQGHVPILYALTRNTLRYSRGRVPSCEDLAFGVKCAVLLLLRTAQDVVCCRKDLAKADRDFIYTHVLAYVKHWVGRWEAESLPEHGTLVAEVEAWAGSTVDLPLPAWATCFSSKLWGVSWGKPETHDVASFQRSTTLTATRMEVAVQFLTALRAATDVNAFMDHTVALYA